MTRRPRGSDDMGADERAYFAEQSTKSNSLPGTPTKKSTIVGTANDCLSAYASMGIRRSQTTSCCSFD
jgi:hypothetical protein